MAQKKFNFSYLKAILCLFFGVCLAAMGLFLSALLMVSRDLSQTFLAPLATLSICVGGCGGAWLLARVRGQNGLFCGVCTGALFSAALFLWSWSNGLDSLERGGLLRIIFVFLSGCIGGYLGMLAAEKRRRHQ